MVPDITCFDYVKSYPLRSSTDKAPDDIFVVGAKCGRIFLCKIHEIVDPVYDVYEGNNTCVLDVAFSPQKANIFVSVSIDSELRVYDVMQNAPIKVIILILYRLCHGDQG